MAKKRASTVKKKEEKLNQIDNIPNYTKQSRSPPPKRRTDFSPFFSSNSGSLLGLSCGRDRLSIVAISSSDDGKDEGEKLCEIPLVLCCKSWGNGSGIISKRFEIPIMEAESVVQSDLADYYYDRQQFLTVIGVFGTRHTSGIYIYKPSYHDGNGSSYNLR